MVPGADEGVGDRMNDDEQTGAVTTRPVVPFQQRRDQTVTLTGRVDVRTVGAVRTRLHCAIDAGHGPLRVDVAGLELGDDAALGVLVGASRRARACGRSMVLVAVPVLLRRQLGRHQLASHLRIESAFACVDLCGDRCAEVCGDPYAHVGHA
jgi:anti-anti-sigma factor